MPAAKRDIDRFWLLLKAHHPLIWINSCDERLALSMVREAVLGTGLPAWFWSATDGLRDALIDGVLPTPHTENPAAAFHAMRESIRRPGLGNAPRGHIAILAEPAAHLDDARTRRSLRELVEALAAQGGCVIVLEHDDSPPPSLAGMATCFELSLPDEARLDEITRSTLRGINTQRSIRIDIPKSAFRALVRNLQGLTERQAAQVIRDVVADDDSFTREDLKHVVSRKRELVGSDGVLEFVQTIASLDDVGGLARMKQWLRERDRAFDDDAAAFGISPPRGMLLLGVQGAGKSLSAKAIATAWDRPLLRLDPSSLYDKFIGESEKTLRKALHQAEMMSPIVLWIDEIEKGFASASSSSNDGGLSRRMFGTLLTWMQDHKAPVFLVATANDIEALPPELLRKGRFDEIFFVDLPGDEAREAILRIHLQMRKRDPEQFDMAALVRASEGYSGAEIEQAVLAGLTRAFAAKGDLTTRLLVEALAASPPLSVIMRDRVESLRAWARNRCVMAD